MNPNKLYHFKPKSQYPIPFWYQNYIASLPRVQSVTTGWAVGFVYTEDAYAALRYKKEPVLSLTWYTRDGISEVVCAVGADAILLFDEMVHKSTGKSTLDIDLLDYLHTE